MAPEKRNPRSTADLLTWSETPPVDPPMAPASRHHPPAGGVGKVLFGGQVTEEEAASLLKRKSCSGYKMREMIGSGIFAADSENGASESGSSFSTPSNKTSVRIVQQAFNAMSQISFSAEESILPKKPTSLAEVAKQRELSGTLDNESETKLQKHISDAKCKELSGHDIFGPPPEVPVRPLAARIFENEKDVGESLPRNMHTSVQVSNPAGGPSSLMFGEETPLKTAKKIHNQKLAELSGTDIFKGDVPPRSAEKPLSMAKLREMNGSDIFSDGKIEAKDYFGGVRKPPGGESTIALV